ncbi:MAG: MBL fold metallo-hydrolase [Aestuariibacter sp.]
MKLHKIEGYIQSVYLAEYPDRLLLLDGASRADIETIRNFIENSLSRPFSDLHTVIVTHMHPDHAGAAHRLRKLTGCKIVAANVPGQWYRGLDGKLMHLTDIMLAKWVSGRMNKPRRNIWYSAYLKPDIKLNDGDNVPNFGEWRVHFTQGHTDRDLSVEHVPSKRVYVADLMVKVKGQFIPPYPVFYPNRYRASILKLQQLAPRSILLAHGGEAHFSDNDYKAVLDRAPKVPMTHWRSVKSKFKKALSK